MKRGTRTLAHAMLTAATVAGTTMILAAPAHAAASDCTVSPANGAHGGPQASVTCPAGAGTFTFRVAVICADAYPISSNPHLFPQNGPWVQASATSVTVSSTTCYGYVPGSGFVWSAAMEVQ